MKIGISVSKVSITVPQLLVLSAIRPKEIPFVKVKEQLELTDGNLFSHARRLQQYGFITKSKKFNGDIPLTSYRITRSGDEYLGWVQAMLAMTPIITEESKEK